MKKKRVFSVFGACLAITFAVGACDADDDYVGERNWSYDQCSTNLTCDTCTAANGCGWCFNSDGSGACGSDANACATEWTWEPNFCRASADASVSSTDGGASCTIPPITIASNGDAATDDASDSDAASEAGASTCALAPSGNLCGASQYEVACSGDVIPAPSPSLGCAIVPSPTPPGVLFYCCPCE